MAGKFIPTLFPPLVADSVADLARLAGFDPAAAARTIAAFNAAIVPGGTFDPALLDDCTTRGLAPPKSHWAIPIDTPPFFCYPARPGITFTYLGVRVDADARVLGEDGSPFQNLFAAGE